MTAKPDPLIHPITRLSICGLLAAGQAVQGHLAWLAQLEETVSASARDLQQASPLPLDGSSR